MRRIVSYFRRALVLESTFLIKYYFFEEFIAIINDGPTSALYSLCSPLLLVLMNCKLRFRSQLCTLRIQSVHANPTQNR
jgi:hypothetical protein